MKKLLAAMMAAIFLLWPLTAQAQDTTPPNPFDLTTPANGAWTNANPLLDWQDATDNVGVAKYKLYVDATAANCSGVPTADNLTQSQYQWGVHWTQVFTIGPSPRYIHAMAYDSQRGKVVLFGGYYGGYRNDTWEWNGISWTQVSSSGPAPRDDHAMAYDSQAGKVVLFGGWDGSRKGDTWEWNGTTWTQVSTTGPAPRYNHAMAYDSQRGKVVLFGGYDGDYLGGTWEWNGTTWTQVSTTGPLPR
ncbi:MAG: kelch repeat-containing protein, partial [bacterium]|nr:kelch repeat-containing protein [bacterium]